MRLWSKVAALLVLMAILAGAAQAAAPEGVIKNETVFVALANDGRAREVRLSAWAHGTPGADYWLDYGRYTDVSNTVSDVQPIVESDRLKWPAAAFARGDLFYQAGLRGTLPVKIGIGYRLDGKSVVAEQLAGKGGTVEIAVHVENLLARDEKISYTGYDGRVRSNVEHLYTPLMVQLSLPVPVQRWKSIDAPGATKVLIGDNLQLSWASFPMPTSDIVLTMVSDRIELDPISIVVVPMAPPLPAIVGDAELKQLISGLAQIETVIGSAAKGGAAGTGLSDLAGAVSQLATAMSSLSQGATASEAAGKSLSAGLAQLQAAHNQLAAQVGPLSSSTDPRLQAIATQIVAEQQAIAQLSQASAQLAGGLSTSQVAGLEQLATGISRMKAAAVEQYNRLRLGQATSDRVKDMGVGYTSFADSRNVNAQTQFVLRTDGVKLPPEDNSAPPQPEPAAPSLWDRIIRFFRGDR